MRCLMLVAAGCNSRAPDVVIEQQVQALQSSQAKTAAPPVSTVAGPRVPTPPPGAPGDPERPNQLLEHGNAALASGDTAAAVTSYRELQQKFEGLPQELDSHLGLGSILLSTGGDAQEALRLFDGYLSAHIVKNKDDEALRGRALALHALGRTNEERLVWEALLLRYPASPQSVDVQVRLNNLK